MQQEATTVRKRLDHLRDALDSGTLAPIKGLLQTLHPAEIGHLLESLPLAERGIVWRYCLLLVPGGLVGLALFRDLPPELLKALIGAFVLLATWAPGLLLLGTHPERGDPRRRRSRGGAAWPHGIAGRSRR